MRIFWDYTPATGEIHIRDTVSPGMLVWTDNRVCPRCGTVDHLNPLKRARWQSHKGDRFYPHLAPLPPDNKPFEAARVRDFLTKIVKKLRPSKVTATGQPKGFLWVFWRLERDVPAKPGTREAGDYFDLSPIYVPKVGVLSKSEWEASRDTAPPGVPHMIVL